MRPDQNARFSQDSAVPSVEALWQLSLDLIREYSVFHYTRPGSLLRGGKRLVCREFN